MSGCFATCSENLHKYNGSSLGIGCCQAFIPKGLTVILISVGSIHSSLNSLNYPCSYAFLGEKDIYNFSVDDLSDRSSFINRTRDNVPIVLEWVVGTDETCFQDQQNLSTYAGKKNTMCTIFDIGLRGVYGCDCLNGYNGNPYLSPGCTDIDECANSLGNPCSNICTNTPGSCVCSCPKGLSGDGLKTGQGISSGIIFLVILKSCIYFTIRRRKHLKFKEQLFDQNGGVLLKQKLLPAQSSKIFSTDELRAATNNYCEDRVFGKGGFGTVYKGTLKDGREVAIKKPKLGDQDKSKIQEFINEVVILMQTNHKNVVKLLGCCLETKVPILVYEFISNGSLLENLKKGGLSWLNWENCIRVATKVVDALVYLHSAAVTPIIHCDIKSGNILLDDNYTAKIADFGASMLTPIGQTLASRDHLLGTLGYMDPESLHTGRLTEKSDVYSFGVVLAELLTKEKVISLERITEEASLAVYFASSMKRHRLLEILDPQLVKELSVEQLLSVGELVLKCLDVDSRNRPTMREVAVKLEGLKKRINHSWEISDQSDDETTSLVSQQHGDLYPASSIEFSSTIADFS